MAHTPKTLETRVALDDFLGPYDCKLDKADGWKGWVSPHFTLDVARQLSADTIRIAEECGYACTETIHLIEGRADSADTVHIIDTGETREINDDGDREPLALAVRVPWRALDRGATAVIGDATPAARKAARESKTTGRGAARAVIVHAQWVYISEGSTTAAALVRQDAEGRFPIGGWEWAWMIHEWWCVCGEGNEWHEAECLCGMNRDTRPTTPLGIATWAAGTTLHRLAPEATTALVDLAGDVARIIAVHAGDTEIDTSDDGGRFDCETLGEADSILRAALDEPAPGTPEQAGWQLVPDEKSGQRYRVTLPAPQQ